MNIITPLQIAAIYGSANTIEALIKAGVNPNSATPKGDTPLHLIADYHEGYSAECVEALIRGGADASLRNNQNLMPEDCTKYRELQIQLQDHRINQERAILEKEGPQNLIGRHTPRIGRGRL